MMNVTIKFPYNIDDDAGQFETVDDLPDDMTVDLHCPSCEQILALPKTALSKPIVCKYCNVEIHCLFEQ